MAYTLYSGDCLEVMSRLPDESIDFIFTDPPYGINFNNNDFVSRWEIILNKPGSPDKPSPRPIMNDSPEDADRLLAAAVKEFARILKPGACCCCCCAGGGGRNLRFAAFATLLDKELDVIQMVVWDKGPYGIGWRYRRSYELVFVAKKPGAPMKWYDTSNRVENIIRPGFRGIKKIIPSSDEHPTAKPVGLPAYFMQLHTQSGDTVLDPFMGGGSTGVAAVTLGRNFIGIELDEHWFRYSERRIAEVHAQQRLQI